MAKQVASTSRVITESDLTEACVRLALEARELQLPPDAADAHDRPDEQGRWPPVLPHPPSALEFSVSRLILYATWKALSHFS